MKEEVSAIPYLRDYAQQHQLPIPEDLPEDCLVLAQKTTDPFGPRRSVDFEVHSDGSVKATSMKPYNLLRFSQNKFQLSVLKLLPVAVGVATGSVAVTTVLALIAFFDAFLGISRKEFQEQDAKVLLAIYRLGKMCHVSTIPAEYQRLFNTSITAEEVRASIELLARYRTVRLRSDDEVEINEFINFTRQ
jgi:hypothetical protein